MPVYLCCVNAAGFLLAAFDKRRAVSGKYRVPEKALFLLAFLGGAAGMYLSMRCFHHKTRHKRFMIGLPAIMAAQAAVWILLRFSVPR